jgi:hypothetical protein
MRVKGTLLEETNRRGGRKEKVMMHEYDQITLYVCV